MAAPTINFSDTNTLSRLVVSLPIPKLSILKMTLSHSLCHFSHIFIKWEMIANFGTTRTLVMNIPKPTKLGKLPLLPIGRQIIITFPPIYKDRSSARRPLRGQLWPRTR